MNRLKVGEWWIFLGTFLRFFLSLCFFFETFLRFWGVGFGTFQTFQVFLGVLGVLLGSWEMVLGCLMSWVHEEESILFKKLGVRK